MEEKIIDSRESDGIRVELYHRYLGDCGGYEVSVYITSKPTRFWHGYRSEQQRLKAEANAREDFAGFVDYLQIGSLRKSVEEYFKMFED